MASDSLTEALAALEAALEAAESVDFDAAAALLAEPVRLFDAAAREALH